MTTRSSNPPSAACLLGRGKVRDIYAVDADKLLIVTSDRLSAFDAILPDPIPARAKCSPPWPTSGSPGSATSSPTSSPASIRKAWWPPTSSSSARPRPGRQAPHPLPIEPWCGYVIGSGLEGLPGHRRHLRHRSPPGSSRPEAAAPIFTRPAGRGRRPDETSPNRPGPTLSSPTRCQGTGRPAPSLVAEARDAALAFIFRPPTSVAAAASSSPTPASSRFGIDAAGTCTSSTAPDAGLLLLARRQLRRGHQSPASDKQYVRPRDPRLGRRPRPTLPADVIRRTAARYVKPTSASPDPLSQGPPQPASRRVGRRRCRRGAMPAGMRCGTGRSGPGALRRLHQHRR